jgi:hypothetical protein|uniref:Uncharacterized protein n=1 Tax=Eutreptiella gymnastica TaxID=73025 RepID=A0A7S4LGS2_9EUGL|eukprot:CAMPEP_0174302144 /NCGR_PEP_ID=MMETSP0809-20121228/59457_1 /TAXON_ID=73025 ORGANISM="Eutreptiella gymnastica-like, Strain CCMP1594" /NCGR_SAMPLE_ID=MMETSP0809 /ASSEMBLY_ACC=CAM_ASM_000658 /LENGTH=120 /DNA_ID=CAMNT_0015408019 /DNA_START=85 /DNA_END=447 /DNA_ORIENTATION=-
MNNGNSGQLGEAYLRMAKRIEDKWMAIPENAEAVVNFPWPSPVRPHQDLWRDTPPNEPPYNNIPDYSKKCPRCGGPGCEEDGFMSLEVREGCRWNGDAWGCTYEYCRKCGWCVWHKWDEY